MSRIKDRKYRRLYSAFVLYYNKYLLLNVWHDYLIGNFNSDQLLFHSMRIGDFIVEKLEIFNSDSKELQELKIFLDFLEKENQEIKFYLKLDNLFDESVEALIYGLDEIEITEIEFKAQLTKIKNFFSEC